MQLNRAALDILATIGPDWTLIASTKPSLRAAQYFLDNVRQFRATLISGRLYVKLDPTIYLHGEPAGYIQNLNKHFDFTRR